MALPVANPKRVLADKGYDGDDGRSGLLMKGILPVIPPRANRKEPIACDFRAYRDRNRIERMFNRLKAVTPHRYPLRQDLHVFSRLPELGSRAHLVVVFRQQDLGR